MRITKMTLAGILAVCWGGALLAGPINSNRPLTLGTSGETSLQQVLTNITVTGPGIDAVADQTNYALFTSTAPGVSTATFIIELAGNADSNTFGIYEAGNTINKAEIFAGTDTKGAYATVAFYDNGEIWVDNIRVATDFGGAFGFYLQNTKDTLNTFYSEDSLNAFGNPQALIYQGDNATTLKIGNFAAGVFTPSQFIIAFEDLPFASSDKDFQDLVVLVSAIQPVPVPEPASLLLLGTGLLGAALIKRRRSRA